MSRYIPEKLRKRVAERAAFRCEYCRMEHLFSGVQFEIDHIVGLKHGGVSLLQNLAYSCAICNGHKGSDFCTFLDNHEDIVRFFNPRKDNWFEHFDVKNGLILPKTRIGAATVKILAFNHSADVIFRQKLIAIGRFP